MRLGEAVGRSLDESGAIQALARSAALTDATEVEQLDHLAAIGHELGLRTSVAKASAQEAAKVLDGGQPLMTVRPEDGRWFVVRAERPGRFLVVTVFRGEDGAPAETTVACDLGELATQLSIAEDDEATWLVAHPSTPNESASTKDAETGPITPVSRLAKLLAPERSDILAILAFAVAIGVLALATPIAVQSIVNSVALGGTLQPLIAVAIFLAVALAFAVTLIMIQTWAVELLQRRIFVRAIADLADRLPRITRAAYEQGFGPERVNRFFDVITIQKSSAKLLVEGVGVVLTVIVGLAVLAFYHPLLLAFDVVLIVAIALIVISPRKRGEAFALRESTAKFEIAGWLEEISRSPQAFKTAGAQRWVVERADDVTRQWLDARTSHFRVLLTQIAGALALQLVASVALLSIGGWLVIQGSLTLGQLVAAELIVSLVVASVAKLGKYLETWYDLMAAVQKVGYLLDLPIESTKGEHPDRPPVAGGAHLQIRGLRWDSAVTECRIDIDSLDLEPGERVALHGLDGTARLALCDLVWRLRPAEGGTLHIDGRSVRDLAPEYLRHEVACVSAIEIVHGSVRENVRLRRPFVHPDDIRSALKLVGLEDRLARLEAGLETPMHPEARILSDDERSCLMLARAIAGQPRLVVIDLAGLGVGPAFRAAVDRALEERRDITFLVLTGPDVHDGLPVDRTERITPGSPAEVLA